MKSIMWTVVLALLFLPGCSWRDLRRENAQLRSAIEKRDRQISKLEKQREHEDWLRQQEAKMCRTLLNLAWSFQKPRLHLDHFDLRDTRSYGGGKVAEADLESGVTFYFTGGGWARPQRVIDVIRKQFGVRVLHLSGFAVDAATGTFIANYNAVVDEALRKRVGMAFHDILESKPVKDVYAALQAEHEESRRKWWAEERKKLPSEKVRNEIWPLFEKGDFETAKKKLGRSMYKVYESYVILTGKATFDRELDFHTSFSGLNLGEVELGVAMQWLLPINPMYRSRPARWPGLRPTVVDVPEAKLKAIFKTKVTVDRPGLPLPVVLERLLGPVGLAVRVEKDRIVVYEVKKAPEK